MSVLTKFPKQNEDRLKRLEALERQFSTDILRLWKRIASTPDQAGYHQTAQQSVDPDDVFTTDTEIFGQSGSSPGSGASSVPSGSLTHVETGGSHLSAGGISGGTPNTGGTFRTGGTLTGGTVQTGATAGTGVTGGHITGGTITGAGTQGTGLTGASGGTPQTGVTGASGGGSGVGVSGGTGLSGSPLSGTPLSGTPQSGVCVGNLFFDQFVGTSGLQLAYHPPNYDRLSGGWQGDTLAIQLSGTGFATPKDAASATGTTEYRAYASMGEKNVDLIATGVSVGSANGGSNRYVGFITRYVSDLDHWILRADVTNQTISIIEVNAGSRTVRASAGIPTAAVTALSSMSATIRDKYMRFKFGNYFVSYGSASYLEAQGRHGIYFAHTGTVNSNQQIAEFTADCPHSDESGSGLSGSRSESHLSGGGVSGGTPANTGGTPVTGGTQPSGTGTGSAFSDPTSDVSYTWADNTAGTNYTRINDAVRSPTNAATGGDGVNCDAGPSDDNEEAAFGMSQPITAGTISKITLYFYAESSGAAITVEGRIKLNGTWQTAVSQSVSARQWYTATFTGSWSIAQVFPLQIGIKPLTINKGVDMFVYASYCKIDYT